MHISISDETKIWITRIVAIALAFKYFGGGFAVAMNEASRIIDWIWEN